MSRHVYAVLPVLALFWPAVSGAGQQESPAPQSRPEAPEPPAPPASTPAAPGPGYPLSVSALLDEIDRLRSTVDALRQELAQARLDANATRRELEEVQQFIADHELHGADFERYRAVKAAAERESRRRRSEAARREHEARQAQRALEQHAVQEQRARDDRERRRAEEYREAGFTPMGMDIYLGASSYNYKTDDGFTARYDWNGLTGGYLRVYPGYRVDFSSMTISGSVLNAGEIARDLAVAVTFFNESGAQVGGEIIQVNAARPGVPYPFTATVTMALDRPFWSASTYVLYADPAE
jgi:multidrug efflux pump subunit AcrA (membrane-fusion protein)